MPVAREVEMVTFDKNVITRKRIEKVTRQ